MKKSEDWSVPRRQSKAAMFLSILGFAKSLLRQFWILIPILLFGGGGIKTEISFLLLVLFFGSLSVVMSIIGYFQFYFWIEDDELIIRKGVLRKSEVNLPLERIQTVNLHQGIFHQLFDIVRVEIDSAGAKGREFEIAALGRSEASDLKSFLLSRAQEKASMSSGGTAVRIDGLADLPEGQLLFQHSFKDLLRIGLSQNHLQTAGIILVFLFGLYENLQGLFLDDLYDFVQAAMGINLDTLWGTLLLFAPVFILASVLVTLVRTVLTEYNMRFWVTPSGFNLKSGLLQRKESIAQKKKIQMVLQRTNPIQAMMSLSSMRLNQASSAEVGSRQSVFISGVYDDQARAILDHKYGLLLQEEKLKFHIDSRFVVRRFLFVGVLPALIVLGFSFFSGQYENLFWLTLLPLIFLYYRGYHTRYSYEVGSSLLCINRGLITKRKIFVEIHKLQAVRIIQSPYQRRKSLCTLSLFTASGSVYVPFVPLDQAMCLYDVFLYKVEKSRKHWM